MPARPPADLEFFLALTLAASRVWPLVRSEFRAAGVDPSHWGLLSHVAAGEAITPTRLSEETGVSTTTIRDQLQALVDRGVVGRRPNPLDARSHLIVLTAEGRRQLDAGLEASRRAREAVEARFGPLEPLRADLLRLVGETAAVVGEAEEREQARLIAEALRD